MIIVNIGLCKNLIELGNKESKQSVYSEIAAQHDKGIRQNQAEKTWHTDQNAANLKR